MFKTIRFTMKIGKLKNDELESLILNKFKNIRNEVECPPHVGIDCARVRVGETCVLSSDPITAAKNRIGYLTVNVNCNDVAAAGAEPIGLMITLLAPPSTTPDELDDIATELAEAAVAANVDIIGGHTEITPAVNQIITSATVIGKPFPAFSGTIQEGDFVIMTKKAGLEGTALLASDMPQKLSLTKQELKDARDMINSISVLKEGIYAASHGAHAMHDITEGGVLGAVWEMAYSAGFGCVIDIDAIPVDNITSNICKQLSIDPYRLISSGSMLIVCPNGDEMKRGLMSIGIQAEIIGKIQGTEIIDKNGNSIDPPEADELYKALSC